MALLGSASNLRLLCTGCVSSDQVLGASAVEALSAIVVCSVLRHLMQLLEMWVHVRSSTVLGTMPGCPCAMATRHIPTQSRSAMSIKNNKPSRDHTDRKFGLCDGKNWPALEVLE